MNAFLIQQTSQEQKDVREFQAHAELAAIRLRNFMARSSTKLPETVESLQLGLRHKASNSSMGDRCASFDVEISLDIAQSGQPPEELCHVDCCFELKYALSRDYQPTREQLTAFQQSSAVFHCWPFMREFVQSATQRMGMNVPPIPMLHLGPAIAPDDRKRKPTNHTVKNRRLQKTTASTKKK